MRTENQRTAHAGHGQYGRVKDRIPAALWDDAGMADRVEPFMIATGGAARLPSGDA